MLDKTEEFLLEKYRLIQFWDYEVENDWPAVKTLILQATNQTRLLNVNWCHTEALNEKEEKQFLNVHHLEHYAQSVSAYGLYYNDELISVMSFTISDICDWQLLRYTTDDRYTVVDGARMLFDNRPYGSFVVYSDRRYDNHLLYLDLGFSFTRVIAPRQYFVKSAWDCGLLEFVLKV